MNKKFLYLNKNTKNSFDNTLSPDQNSALLFIEKQDDKIVLTIKDNNAQYQYITQSQVEKILQDYLLASDFSDGFNTLNNKFEDYVKNSDFSDGFNTLNNKFEDYILASDYSDGFNTLNDRINNINIDNLDLTDYVKNSDYSQSISTINDRIDNITLGQIDTTILATKQELNNYVLSSDFSDSINTINNRIDNINIDEVDNVRKNANITLPIPYDSNNENVTFIMDICEDGTFEDEVLSSQLSYSSDNSISANKYFRISMRNPLHRSYMKIFSKDKFIDVPDEGVNLPYYGQNLSFTLNNIIYPNYIPGKTYYARYTWMDYQGAILDWKGLKFQYDVIDASIPLNQQEEINIYEQYYLSQSSSDSDQSVSSIIDYNNGDIQKFYFDNKLDIDTDNIINIPHGKSIKIFCVNINDNSKKYLIEIYNIGEIVSTIQELF